MSGVRPAATGLRAPGAYALRFPAPLPVPGLAGRAYSLLWEHRLLHARAIWPPVLFLVAAEFLYHRIVGNAGSLTEMWRAMRAAPWWMPAGAALFWLAGLKFLLSFSISWRRHLLLDERFDPFFFKAPFWRYLGFLLLVYAAILLLAALLLPPGVASYLEAVLMLTMIRFALVQAVGVSPSDVGFAALAIGVLVGILLLLLLVVRLILRQVPFFTILSLDPPQPGWRDAVRAMRGSAWRYLAAFVLAMLPVVALDLLLDAGLTRAGADRHSVPVALGEAAFRQAMLFVHFSLGASIGAITTTTVLPAHRDG